MSNLVLPCDFGNTPKKKFQLPKDFSSLLLHCCCAPCVGAMLEYFYVNKLKPTVFFYNPNIHPKEEYLKRRDELISLCNLLNFPYVIPEYDTNDFFCKVKGLEHEPERGRRCDECFKLRLLKTAQYAKDHNFSHFTSTLATSRWKRKSQVDNAGFFAESSVNGLVKYWQEDWRKEGLVIRRYELVKKFNFYNQEYCGCIYSKLNLGHVKEK